MSDSVSKEDLHEIATQLKELVIEVRHSNESVRELKNVQVDQGKRIAALEIEVARRSVAFDDLATIKKFIIGAIVSFVASACVVVYQVGSNVG